MIGGSAFIDSGGGGGNTSGGDAARVIRGGNSADGNAIGADDVTVPVVDERWAIGREIDVDGLGWDGIVWL